VWTAGSNPGERDDATAEMLLKYDPDFICLQEFDPLYRNASNGLIGQLSAQYTEVEIDGMTTADAKNKIYNPIFYDHSKYTQKASGYVWFKDVIDVVDNEGNPLSALTKEYNYPASGTTYGRCLVWAVLQDEEGDRFLVANTHFSQQDKDTEGENPLATRSKIHTVEATFVANTLKGIAKGYEEDINDGYQDITVLVGGDMNSNVNNNPDCGVDMMVNEEYGLGFTHTYTMTANRNNSATSTNSRDGFDTGYLDYAIDHILTLNENLNVHSFYVLTEMDAKVTGPDGTEIRISDHLPVRMTFYK